VLTAHKTPLVTFKSTKLPYVPLALAIKTQKFFPLKKKKSCFRPFPAKTIIFLKNICNADTQFSLKYDLKS